jgi:hypothetical protein
MASESNGRSEVTGLVERARVLLDRLDQMTTEDPARMSEVVVELQKLLDRLRRIYPPKVFDKK